MIDVDAALIEITTKSAQQIERETARAWAARAIACWRLARGVNIARGTQLYRQADDYEHEALEHAALARDGGATLAEVEGAFVVERST